MSKDKLSEHELRCYELAEYDTSMMPVAEMTTIIFNLVFHSYVKRDEDEVKKQHDGFFQEETMH